MIMHLRGSLERGRKWDTRPVCRTALTYRRLILCDAVRWWNDNTKLSGHPAIRYLWTCHHSVLLITCTLLNLSSVICCHCLMTMALACFQVTQRHQAIMCLNQKGDLQYMKVEYSISFEQEAQKRQDVQRANCIQTTKGKKVPNVSFCFHANTTSWAH